MERVSQVPGRPIHTRRPLSPREARQVHMLITSLTAAGFTFSGRLATLHWCNEAETGSLALRLMRSAHGASAKGLLPNTARLTFMVNEQVPC